MTKEQAYRMLLLKIQSVLLVQYAMTRSTVDAELIADITAVLAEPKDKEEAA